MLQKYFAKLLTSDFYLFSSTTLQRGQSTAYVIILVIIVIFAVMLSGGGHSLFTGNVPSSITDTPTPGGTATPAPSPTSTPSATWNIAVTLNGCQQGKSNYMAGSVKVDGPSNGTVELIVGTNTVGSQQFTTPTTTYPLMLTNASGFNTSNWKITVTSGGAIQKTYNGQPTNCQ